VEWDLIQLTWQSELGFVYRSATFEIRRTFGYPGEGWGLTHDARNLILSDGSPTLRFLDPVTFKEVRRVQVQDRGMPIKDLNELEFVRGEIYANVWHSDRIARISPKNGQVLGWIDLESLLPSIYRRDPEAVLNGIAYDQAGDRLFVTGKFWPKLFEVKVR
jgi:glutamine cyclotransferase